MLEEGHELYDLMNWGAMEALVYSEHDDPHTWLGPHIIPKGLLYNTFQPTVSAVSLMREGKEYPMTATDGLGNFSVLIPRARKLSGHYTLRVTYDDGTICDIIDPYAFEPMISAEDEDRFIRGVHYDIYNILGAHVRSFHGVKGTYFAVWAPNAERVSVVGNFNLWDGRRHPMRKLRASGIFELFVPGVAAGEIYKYEIKTNAGTVFFKTDPYGNAFELRPANASIVTELSHKWKDSKWMERRRDVDPRSMPMSVYEVHLGSWHRDNGAFIGYRELAPMLAEYVIKQGYTHIELLPIMEHPFDGSWGYQVTGYFAPTSRYGSPEDFMYFIDYMHSKDIGVILDWVPAHFPKDEFALAGFDGTCLFEHPDKRLGEHPDWGTLIFNFGRPEVSNFLIASALFWTGVYHADGLRVDAVASMLYLDYGRRDGEWVANKFGGKENLEAIELFKHLNSILHKRHDGAVIIAEESTAWPGVCRAVEEGGLGFDLKWNMGWMNDFTSYMKQDPLFRKYSHGQLTFGMMYAYSENFILVFSHDEVVHLKRSMLGKMPGEGALRFANLRAAYGFMIGHPGKKLLFMGQEFGQEREWCEDRELDWELTEEPQYAGISRYCAALNRIYRLYPAMTKLDNDPAGFTWMSCMDADHSIVSFIRKTEDPADTLLFVCNFTPVYYDKYVQAVPFEGTYREILCSDSPEFGGWGNTNQRARHSRPVPKDGQSDSITMKLPSLGVCVFKCTPTAESEKE